MNPGHLPLKNLIAFDAAARLGSFSKAADELSLTQSAISQQVQKLEGFVGQSLFLRKSGGISLTAAGELLHQTVQDALARLTAGLERIEPYRNQNSVILGVPADFAHGWLAPRLAELRALRPDHEIWLVINEEVREIDRVDMDLIVSRWPIHTADVECTALMEDASIAVCGPRLAARIGHMPFPRVLEKAPLLFLEDAPNWGGMLSDTGNRALNLQRGGTMDDARVVLDAVEQEVGLAYLPRVLCQSAIESGRVVVLTQVPAKSQPRLWLMRSRLPARTPFVEQVFEWLRTTAGNTQAT